MIITIIITIIIIITLPDKGQRAIGTKHSRMKRRLGGLDGVHVPLSQVAVAPRSDVAIWKFDGTGSGRAGISPGTSSGAFPIPRPLTRPRVKPRAIWYSPSSLG